MFYDALCHQDTQPYDALLWEQQCINCLADESVGKLRSGMLLCEACQKVMSPKQEAKLFDIIASVTPQCCTAKWPNGRPCWGVTRANSDICRNNPDCPANPKNYSRCVRGAVQGR